MRGSSTRKIFSCLCASLLALAAMSCERSDGGAGPDVQARQPVEVFVVTSLEPLITAAIDEFAPDRDRLDFFIRPGSSQSLARQVQAGARVDLIVSANPSSLEGIDPAPRTVLPWIVDRLVVVTPPGSTKTLRDFDFGQEAIAVAGDHTDLGLHTRLAMRSRETWSASQGRLQRAADASEVLRLVAEGAAAFGVVQATDAAAAAQEFRIVADLDLPDSVELDYFLAPYSPEGDQLADWLTGPEGVALARRWGYEQAAAP